MRTRLSRWGGVVALFSISGPVFAYSGPPVPKTPAADSEADASAELTPPPAEATPTAEVAPAPAPPDEAASAPVKVASTLHAGPPAPPPPPIRLEQRPEDTTAKVVLPPTALPAAAAAPSPAPTSTTKIAFVPGVRYILSGHQENYFATTAFGDRQTVKFQYSFKFDLWPNSTRHSVYFGFTQKSLWALWDFKNSSAFIDSNYAPEIFYGYYKKDGDVVPVRGRVTWTWVYAGGVGLLHESNGDGGAASRSWNRIYATARGGAYFGTDHYVTLAPRVWAPPVGVDEYNPDIVDYLGYGSLTAEYGYDPVDRAWWGGGHVGVTASKGGFATFSRPTFEAFLQWRPAYEGRFVAWWKFTPYIYVQARHGYADMLLTYNKEDTAVRIGFALEDRVNWVSVPR